MLTALTLHCRVGSLLHVFFFQHVYLKYTNAVASLLTSLCRIQLFWYWIFSVSVFFCHLLWGCFIRLLENDWCCQKPCINQLIVDKMVECVLMSVGSLGPADSKFIFLNIRKRRSKICNFYDTWKRRVEILCFSKCLEKKWGLHTPRSLPINLNMKSTSCWQHWRCTVGWGVFSIFFFFSICISQIHKRSC